MSVGAVEVFAAALESVDVPRTETPEEDGPSITITGEDGIPTIQKAGGWISSRVDYNAYADRLLQEVLAAGYELRRFR